MDVLLPEAAAPRAVTVMPIRLLSLELVRDIVESYGQITKLNLSSNGECLRIISFIASI